MEKKIIWDYFVVQENEKKNLENQEQKIRALELIYKLLSNIYNYITSFFQNEAKKDQLPENSLDVSIHVPSLFQQDIKMNLGYVTSDLVKVFMLKMFNFDLDDSDFSRHMIFPISLKEITKKDVESGELKSNNHLCILFYNGESSKFIENLCQSQKVLILINNDGWTNENKSKQALFLESELKEVKNIIGIIDVFLEDDFNRIYKKCKKCSSEKVEERGSKMTCHKCGHIEKSNQLSNLNEISNIMFQNCPTEFQHTFVNIQTQNYELKYQRIVDIVNYYYNNLSKLNDTKKFITDIAKLFVSNYDEFILIFGESISRDIHQIFSIEGLEKKYILSVVAFVFVISLQSRKFNPNDFKDWVLGLQDTPVEEILGKIHKNLLL